MEKFQILFNTKNGQAIIKNENIYAATQFLNAHKGNQVFVGFISTKRQFSKMLGKLKQREIKERLKNIEKLQKEISIIEKFELPIL